MTVAARRRCPETAHAAPPGAGAADPAPGSRIRG